MCQAFGMAFFSVKQGGMAFLFGILPPIITPLRRWLDCFSYTLQEGKGLWFLRGLVTWIAALNGMGYRYWVSRSMLRHSLHVLESRVKKHSVSWISIHAVSTHARVYGSPVHGGVLPLCKSVVPIWIYKSMYVRDNNQIHWHLLVYGPKFQGMRAWQQPLPLCLALMCRSFSIVRIF